MAAKFVAASSQRLENTVSTSANGFSGTMPFTVGFWAYPTTTGANRSMWTIADTGAAQHYHTIMQLAANTWAVETFDNAGSSVAFSAGTVTANEWHYLVYRAIATANKRLAILQPSGLSVHVATTTGDTPDSALIDTMLWGNFRSFGVADTNFFSGNLAEGWIAEGNIQADGLALQDSTLRQLAYYGPFSIPQLVRNIVEYKSFRSRLIGSEDAVDEVYVRGNQRKPWVNVNGVTLGPHPPLAGGYVRPSQLERKVLV